MGERPVARVDPLQAVVALLIAPSVVGAVAMFVADPVTGLAIGGLTLGVTTALLWSARRGRLVAAGLLFLIAVVGTVTTIGMYLGGVGSTNDLDRSVGRKDALDLAGNSFLIAMAASIVLAVIQGVRSDNGRASPAAAAASEDGGRPEARRRTGLMMPVGIWSVPLTIGAIVGYTNAYPWNAPGGLEELGRVLARVPILVIFLAIGIALIVGIAARAKGGPRGGHVGRLAFGGAGILGLAALGGFLLTPVLGVPYGVPFVAFGSATLRFDSLRTFTPQVGGYVECETVAGPAPSSVYGEVGWLESGELNTLLLLGAEGPDLFLIRRHVNLRYGLSEVQFHRDLTSYAARPTVIHMFETTDQGSSGRVTFHLPRVATDEADGGWPAARSGQLTWTCGDWVGSAPSDTDQGGGRLDLRLDGVDWVPAAASATCEIEAGGSVGYLWSDSAGMLSGTSVDVTIDLRAEHAVGSEVSVWIEEVDPNAAFGQELPWWQSRLRLVEVAEGDRSGRAAFVDMPSYGPVSTALPDTLTGEVSWSCT